jgi:cytoskeleton protein RodZ
MKRTGQILKDAREKLGLSLVEVSIATKINAKILAAIENGDDAHLPARTFLRGFLRSYAAFLKLDVEMVLSSYNDEVNETKNKPETQAEPPAQTSSSALPDIEARSRTLKTIAIVSMIVLVILILIVRNVMEKYERERLLGPAFTAPSASPLASPSANESPAVAVAAEPSPQPPPPAAPSAAAAVPSPAPVPSIAPVKALPPAPPHEEEVKPEPSPTPSPVAKRRDVEREIIIEALDKVTVKFTLSKGETSEVQLQPDEVHTIKTRGSVTLDVSDGGAIDIIVNGRDTGVPGDLGKPKTVKIP